MATGDITISIAVAGGATKSATINSASRVLAKALNDSEAEANLSADADWQIYCVNKFASQIVRDANRKQETDAVGDLTAKTYTAAS
ncbi:MAG: hypothetical protein KAJ19_20080 [Gammaproteobacteria bacterium]|nr:hypothetical protein [Gammaproteobacteria bacterium]